MPETSAGPDSAGLDREQAVLDAVPTGLFIGGTWRPAASGATLAVDDPATGKTLVEVANAAPDDGRAALDAAVAAQPGFAAMPPRERGEILRRAYELIMSRVDDLALLMTLEMGKPLAESKGEVAYAAEFFRWFAEEAVRIDGQYAVAPNGASRFLVMRQPVGVCLLVTPWNFPMAMGTRKIGPPSPPAAPWSSSPRSRPRCRCTPSPRSSPRPACPTACSTS